ncbi:hypothetical protein H696_02169 [Fonticula alba]|uniref:RNA helicase n=1 Tax=Fonticula alba TaxID=691883 RepID=A0A058ZBC1_FONAL|nr:hypothetical protein H696_02169 [Fonticula alba]KCV71218.1 hypothetical protein H696_02169 [Fonticula alba]|eukprot:XP_009494341.1 hypothetical protein H696_02169 [Fonticula alba]
MSSSSSIFAARKRRLDEIDALVSDTFKAPAPAPAAPADAADAAEEKPLFVPRRQRDPLHRGVLAGSSLGALARAEADAAPRQSVFNREVEEEKPVSTRRADIFVELLAKQKEEELNPITEEERRRLEDEALLKQIEARKPLQAGREFADGIVYTEPLRVTAWQPPRFLRELSMEDRRKIWRSYHAQVRGDDVPAPARRYEYLKFPTPIMDVLRKRGIKAPLTIQAIALPIVMSGRDMIGIAATGQGKTLAFALPMVALAMEAEIRLPFVRGEGPHALCIVPSKELATQIYDNCEEFCKALVASGRYPQLRSLLCIGGINMNEQMDALNRGVHIVVATPGRLKDMLHRRRLNLDSCRMLVMDEADRMLDPTGFEEDVREIVSYFRGQRQTLLFSATMPPTVGTFAQSSLVRPVVVNVTKSSIANSNISQEVHYVPQVQKTTRLMDVLDTTPPPVLVFAQNKRDVNDIHEYLLARGVAVDSIHGDRSSEERTNAVRRFRAGDIDILVATDVMSKGLDFPNIQHVINFDMPDCIENYIHRIGRTGRGGNSGVASTFINDECDRNVLADLSVLLYQAKQPGNLYLDQICMELGIDVPRVVAEMESADAAGDASGADGDLLGRGGGCVFCGGRGHTANNCPKMLKEARRVMASARASDMSGGGGF